MSKAENSLHEILHDLKHYLPTQTPLKDFIHHNSLHAFQGSKFYDGIFKASKIFGYQVTLQLLDFRNLMKVGRINEGILDKLILKRKGNKNFETWKANVLTKKYDENNDHRIGTLRANWKEQYQIDLDSRVQPFLFRILGGYLDQGIAIWEFPQHPDGFLASLIDLENHSFRGLFKTKRAKALLNGDCSLVSLLKIVVGNESYYRQYLFDQQFSHRGWSGMAAVIEERPDTLLNPRKIKLEEMIRLELLLEIDALDYKHGTKWKPLCEEMQEPPLDLFADITLTELQEVFMIWQDAFEWSYYDLALAGIETLKRKESSSIDRHSFQAVFCIDERECSIRRHIERVDTKCETFGMPGFFGVEFFFQPNNAKFIDKLCPAPVTPKYLIKEYDVKVKRKHELLYTNKAHTLLGGYFVSFTLGFIALGRLVQNLFRPKMSPAISNAFAHMFKESKLQVENRSIDDVEQGLQVGFTITEMADRVEGALRGIGLIRNFAPVVYIVAHGSSSANNPHHGAHDCGACSGRPGSVNARVLSIMGNHEKVRENLASRGLLIPAATQFVGALHDTASDEIEFFDEHVLSEENKLRHQKSAEHFELALDNNAKERSRRFASINTKQSLKQVRAAIKQRSVSLFEPRPELGHGTNSLCFIGRRSLTKGLFLDRRAFMNSYDYSTDLEGELLFGVIKPIGVVCGGINLEYYFSRVDNLKLGAGTKLPHNVMGLIGVANSSDGDLRPGLPLQMIEVHDPIRLLVIVEHYPEVVLKTIKKVPEVFEWYKNEWVHILSVHPETGAFCFFKNGQFIPYETHHDGVESVSSMHDLVESAREMETNHIVHATKENLPIYVLD